MQACFSESQCIPTPSIIKSIDYNRPSIRRIQIQNYGHSVRNKLQEFDEQCKYLNSALIIIQTIDVHFFTKGKQSKQRESDFFLLEKQNFPCAQTCGSQLVGEVSNFVPWNYALDYAVRPFLNVVFHLVASE
jgi:hypothetical protein